MNDIALIAVAGALGAVARYGMQNAVAHVLGRPTILGTMAVNLIGCFLIGLLIALALDRHLMSNTTRLVLTTGFLGAFTTFSALMFDATHSLETSDLPLAVANVGLSVVLGLCLTYAGLLAGRSL